MPPRAATAVARFVFIPLALLAVLSASEARAQALDIDDPGVKKGEREIKSINLVNGRYPAGTSGAPRSSHEIDFAYGVTDWLKLLLHADVETIVADRDRLDHLGFESQIALLDAEKGGLGLAWHTSVMVATDPDATNVLFWGPLIKLAGGKQQLTVNTYFERSFGQNSSPGVSLNYGWQIRHEVSDVLAIALEGFGRIPDLAQAPSVAEQDHRAGLSVYRSFAMGEGTATISLGALVGLTREAPDSSLRLSFGVTH